MVGAKKKNVLCNIDIHAHQDLYQCLIQQNVTSGCRIQRVPNWPLFSDGNLVKKKQSKIN